MTSQKTVKRFRPFGNNLRTFDYNYAPVRVTYKLIDGLYQSTILNKIITKYVSSTVPNYFNVQVENLDGTRNEEAEEVLRPLSASLNRNLFKSIMKNYFLYGTAIVYHDGLDNIFCLPVKYVNPVFETKIGPKFGDLLYFEYTQYDDIIKIPLENISVLAHDADDGDLFGHSIVSPLMNTLSQYLNNQLALCEILDTFSLPLLFWAVNTEDLSNIEADDYIRKIRDELLLSFDAGEDVVADDRVNPDILSLGEGASNLVSILNAARTDLGMAGVPQAILGGPADNLSSSKVQIGFFFDEIRTYQTDLNDFLAYEFYEPFLKEHGFEKTVNYKSVYLNFPVATNELPSDQIIWLKSALELGLISQNEARATLGFRGPAPGMDEAIREYYEVKKGTVEEANKVNTPGRRDGSDPDSRRNNQ